VDKPNIAIVLSTTRRGRFGDKPAQWIHGMVNARDDLSAEIVDLRDHPLPFFDEPASPIHAPSQHPAGRRWSETVAAFDGFIFITAEYNHGIPAVLKNALDYCYREFNRKPAAFLGYGGLGGARAVEQLRLICVELEMAPTRRAVHIGRDPYAAVIANEKSLSDFAVLQQSALEMLYELAWWTRTLKAGREADSPPKTMGSTALSA
jgi:NAD(P)H-dependent FMN reductase